MEVSTGPIAAPPNWSGKSAVQASRGSVRASADRRDQGSGRSRSGAGWPGRRVGANARLITIRLISGPSKSLFFWELRPVTLGSLGPEQRHEVLIGAKLAEGLSHEDLPALSARPNPARLTSRYLRRSWSSPSPGRNQTPIVWVDRAQIDRPSASGGGFHTGVGKLLRRSKEPGHSLMLDALGADALLCRSAGQSR